MHRRLTHKHPSVTHSGAGDGAGRKCRANLSPIQHNEPLVTLSYHLGLGVPVPTCAGGFILLDFDKAGKLAVVLD